MGTTIGSATFRRAEAQALKDGKIDASDVKDLVAAAKNEDKQVIRQMLATDAFEPGARKQLSDKLLGKSVAAPAESKIAGIDAGQGVTVTRELGTTGYADQFQAIAAARMSGVENTGVVLGKDNLWHPVQLSEMKQGLIGPAKGVRAVMGLKNTDEAKVSKLQGEIKDILVRTKGKPTSDEDVKALNEKRAALAAEVFGVDPSMINVISDSKYRQTGMININTGMADDGKHGAEQHENAPFNPRELPAVEVSSRLLEGEYKTPGFKDGQTTPARFEPPPSIEEARTTLFHEATHESDYDKSAEWVRKWEGGTRFHPNQKLDAERPDDFIKWMSSQNVDQATKNSVINFVKGNHADTEARAYLSAAVIAMQSGNIDAARDQLMTFAGGLADGRVPIASERQVTDAKLKEVKAAYDAMPAAQKKEFRALWAEVSKAHPGWPGKALELK